MQGLLDFMKTPEGQGLLSMVAGGLATAGQPGRGPLNTIGAAGLAGLQGYSGALERQEQAAQNKQMQEARELQIKTARLQLQQQEEAAQFLARMSGRGQPAATSQPAAPVTSPVFKPEYNAERQGGATAVPPWAAEWAESKKPTAAPAAPAAPEPSDIRAQIIAMANSGNPVLMERAKALAEIHNLDRDEYGTEPRVMMLNGKPVNVLVSKQGNVKQLDYGVRPDLKTVDLKDRVVAYDANATAPGQSWRVGQSPDSAASNALGWANHRQAGQRMLLDAYDVKETPEGLVYVPKIPGKAAVPVVGGAGQRIMGSNGSNITEGERKAGTLLGRLQQAEQQMALVSSTKAGADAANPAPFSAQTPNFMKSGERQRVEAAQLDFLDAGLTLATGAAYTQEQLKGALQMYFPRYGDDAKTIEEKAARRANLIEMAKLAAGKAGSQVKPVLEAPKPSVVEKGGAGGWSAREVSR